MRKVIVSNLVSLDGFFAGPNGELDWFVVNDEFFDYTRNLINSVDTILYGRVTYEGMVGYWPTPAATVNDPIMANGINSATKIVFSKTLTTAAWGEWKNIRLVSDKIGDEIAALKQQPGKDIVIFGSGSIVAALTALGLIDEYQLLVVPVILGSGKSMFDADAKSTKLKLLVAKPFQTGVVLLTYEPEGR